MNTTLSMPASPRVADFARASGMTWPGSEADSAGIGGGLLSPTSEVGSTTSFSGAGTQVVSAEAHEAKRARKMLDLEITNKSLLAINASLEVAKLQQAREIRELKRRLREGRMSLAPKATGAGSDGVSGGEAGVEGRTPYLFEEDEEDDDASSDADSEMIVQEDPELEAIHANCKALIDRMIEDARDAIRYRYEPAKGEGLGGKVLHPIEVQQLEMERRESSARHSQDDTTEADETIESESAANESGTSRSEHSFTNRSTQHGAQDDAEGTTARQTFQPSSVATITDDAESNAATETGHDGNQSDQPPLDLFAAETGNTLAPTRAAQSQQQQGGGLRIPSTASVDISVD